MSDRDYDLYGTMLGAWLITLRVDRQGIVSAKTKEKREAPTDPATFQEWCRLASAPRPDGLVLPCTGINAEWQREDGFWKLEWEYEGFNGDPGSVTFGDPATTAFEIDCSVTTAPVESHPRFAEIVKKYASESQIDKKTKEFHGFVPFLPDPSGKGTVKSPLYGTQDYYVSSMVWRVSSCAVNLPADFRRNLGKIDTPRSQGGPPLPQLQGQENWLKTIARATWRGNIFQTSEEWAASTSGLPWNPDLYRPNG